MESVTEPVAKRADQLVVGDRISGERLPAFSSSDADVVFVRKYELHGEWWVFVAYLPDDGNYDSVTYRADGEIEVVAQAPQPVAERPLVGEGGVWAVPVAGGLIEVDPPEDIVPASGSMLLDCPNLWHDGLPGDGPDRCPTCGEAD